MATETNTRTETHLSLTQQPSTGSQTQITTSVIIKEQNKVSEYFKRQSLE